MTLERREVVQKLRRLALFLLLELRDLAGLPRGRADDRVGVGLRDPLAAEVAGRVLALAGGGEERFHEPVRLRLEGADRKLAADDERERRRLHAAERDSPVERRAKPNR